MRETRVLKLTIAYDGTRYAGWQRQNHRHGTHPSIQAELERALSRVLHERVRVTGSGRTDSGVHALAQVAHMRTRSRLPSSLMVRAINSQLPNDIVVSRVSVARGTFHAQRDATRKAYRYRIRTGAASPFDREYVYHVHGALNVAAMRRAARALTGTHDFAPFQAAGSPRQSTVRRLTGARVQQHNGYVDIELAGKGFL